MKAGSAYVPNVAAISQYKCVPEQPSGCEHLYIWSFKCPEGMTYQWCAAHHRLWADPLMGPAANGTGRARHWKRVCLTHFWAV
jgi:hypothetical protein